MFSSMNNGLYSFNTNLLKMASVKNSQHFISLSETFKILSTAGALVELYAKRWIFDFTLGLWYEITAMWAINHAVTHFLKKD